MNWSDFGYYQTENNRIYRAVVGIPTLGIRSEEQDFASIEDAEKYLVSAGGGVVYAMNTAMTDGAPAAGVGSDGGIVRFKVTGS
jgi:hypothetical protein